MKISTLKVEDYWDTYGTPEFQWLKNGVPIPSETGEDLIYSDVEDGDQITCRITQNYVCETQPTATSSVFRVRVSPVVTPSVSIGSNPLGEVCDGETIQLFRTSQQHGGSEPELRWYVDGVQLSRFSPDTLDATAFDAGTEVFLRLNSNASCATKPSDSSNVITIQKRDVPGFPGAISGDLTPCEGSTERYSIAPVAGATSYVWTVGGAKNDGSTTTATNLTFGASGGFIQVAAQNDCGVGQTRSEDLGIALLPDDAGDIVGPTEVCSSSAGYVYGIPEVNNATGYQWSIPVGFTMTNGSGTNEVTLSSGSAGGSISVEPPERRAEQGGVVALPVTLSDDLVPSVTIDGVADLCEGENASFRAFAVNGGVKPSFSGY